MLKYIFDEEMPQQLPEIMALLRELADKQTAVEYLQTLLRYVSAATDAVTEQDMRQALTTAFPEEEGDLMATLAKEWRQQGNDAE